MPESSPISMICAQIVGIQGMSGLLGLKRAYIQLGQPFFPAQPCRHTIEQVHIILLGPVRAWGLFVLLYIDPLSMSCTF